MAKLTRKQAIEKMVDYNMEDMSVSEAYSLVEDVLKHGGRGLYNLANEELEKEYFNYFEEGIEIVEGKEFYSGLSTAIYLFEDEFTVKELLNLLDNLTVDGKSLLEVMLESHVNVVKESKNKYIVVEEQ